MGQKRMPKLPSRKAPGSGTLTPPISTGRTKMTGQEEGQPRNQSTLWCVPRKIHMSHWCQSSSRNILCSSECLTASARMPLWLLSRGRSCSCLVGANGESCPNNMKIMSELDIPDTDPVSRTRSFSSEEWDVFSGKARALKAKFRCKMPIADDNQRWILSRRKTNQGGVSKCSSRSCRKDLGKGALRVSVHCTRYIIKDRRFAPGIQTAYFCAKEMCFRGGAQHSILLPRFGERTLYVQGGAQSLSLTEEEERQLGGYQLIRFWIDQSTDWSMMRLFVNINV